MSVLGHIAIGAVTGRALARQSAPAGGRHRPDAGVADHRGDEVGPGGRIGDPEEGLLGRMAALATLALLPDVDLILRAIAPETALFDHRGPSHSLALAAIVGIGVGIALRLAGHRRAVMWAAVTAAVVASHGLMDMLGNSSLGVELLWPISDARLLAPWQVLPDPSLEPPLIRNLVGQLVLEAIVYIPMWVYAFVPRSLLRRASSRAAPG